MIGGTYAGYVESITFVVETVAVELLTTLEPITELGYPVSGDMLAKLRSIEGEL